MGLCKTERVVEVSPTSYEGKKTVHLITFSGVERKYVTDELDAECLYATYKHQFDNATNQGLPFYIEIGNTVFNVERIELFEVY